MVRVLQVISGLTFGGVQNVVLNYYKNIDRSKIQFDFAIMEDTNGELEGLVQELGAKIYRFPNIYKNPKDFSKAFLKFLKEHREYQIVHAHMNFQNLYILKCAKKARVKMRISHSHSAYKSANKLVEFVKKIAKKRIVKYATNCWACSKVAGEWLYGNAVNSEKFCVIKNAIDIENYSFSEKKRDDTRKEFGLKDEFLFIHTGTFYKAKNHYFLLKVFNELQKEVNCKLMLVGDGVLKKKIESQTKELGIYDKVIFTGAQSNVSRFLSAADALIFPSLFEGLPMTVVEAQANGLICFLSQAIPNEVVYTDNCFYCDDFDESLWRDYIIDTLKNKKRSCNSFSELCEYDIKNASANLLNLYRRGIDETIDCN